MFKMDIENLEKKLENPMNSDNDDIEFNCKKKCYNAWILKNRNDDYYNKIIDYYEPYTIRKLTESNIDEEASKYYISTEKDKIFNKISLVTPLSIEVDENIYEYLGTVYKKFFK